MTATVHQPLTLSDPALLSDVGARVRHRMRLLVGCVLIVTICFLQDPGLLVADTKLDLAVAPLRFLGRTFHLWDQSHDLGRLQDQAVGYLFPMGPAYAIGHLLGLPVWVVQRLWMATLLTTAFLGAARVSSRLGVRGSWPVVLSGCFYVAAPRALSLVSTVSSEILPWALLPWALLALMPRSGLLGRRGAARSGLAVLAMGGINAAAVFAVLPVPALWLLTRRWSWSLARVVVWWLAALLLAVAWWLVPLLFEARYGFGFLGYTESAAATTTHNGPGEALRGVADWVGYLGIGGLPWLRAGWWLSTDGVAAVFTAIAAAGGAAGLALRGVPHRRFLVLCLALGTACVTLGHVGELAPSWAPAVHHLLDGPLAPFRNTHKFDPMIRLPLAVGVGHLIARARVVLPGRAAVPAQRFAALGAVAILVVATVPAFQGTLPSRGSFTSVPAYWQQAAAWLDAHADRSTTLGLPAAGFGEYDWGRPLDDPLGVLAASSTVSRNLIPLGSAGETRVLDAVEAVIGSGHPSPGLAAYLQRAGIRYLLVRNDLSRYETGAPWPAIVHQALDESPGVRRVATFGPDVGPVFSGAAALQYSGDLGLDMPFPALEVFEVAGTSGPVSAYPVDSAVAMSGGPESLLEMADAGLLGERATVLAADVTPGLDLGGTVVTDGLRRREVSFGLVRGNASSTLSSQDPFRLAAPQHDYLPVVGASHQTVAALTDGVHASASSSASDASVVGVIRGPQFQPANAFDSDPSTVWLSSPDQSVVGQWARLDLDQPVDASVVALRLAGYASQPQVTRLTLTTDQGSHEVAPQPGDSVQVFSLPAGRTRSISIRVDAVAGAHPIGAVVGLVDVSLPGVQPQRTIVVPSDSTVPGPTAFLFATPSGARGACVPAASVIVCQPLLASPGEETRLDRTFAVPGAETVVLAGTATPRPGPELDALLAAHGRDQSAVASSSLVPDPAGNVGAAFDGDGRTAWIAGAAGSGVSLTLDWLTPRRISTLDFLVPAGLPASPPAVIHVHSPAGDRDGLVTATGHVELDPLTTRSLTITFPRTFQRYSVSLGQVPVVLPVGFAEVQVDGEPNRASPSATVVLLPCGQGPTVSLDGRPLSTALATTLGDILALRPAALSVCAGPERLEAGAHRLFSDPGGAFRATGMTVDPVGMPAVGASAPDVQVVRWAADQREVRLPQGAGASGAYLVVHENFNEGWLASASGHGLKAVRVDGWQQGWVLPTGTTDVQLTFAPDQTYRGALAVGGLLLLLLLALALAAVRRPDAGQLRWRSPAEAGQAWTELGIGVAVVVLVGGGWGALAVLLALAVRFVLPRSQVLALIAAAGALATGWSALPTVTLPGSVPLGAPAVVAAAGGIAVLAVVLAAAVPARRRERAGEPATEQTDKGERP